MTDAFDLATALVHDSPADIASWPITIGITQLDFSPDPNIGQTITAPVPARWDFHVPGWGDIEKGGTDKGNILYTVWALVNVGGQWHTAGVVQNYTNKWVTGAPILTMWKEWAYDRNRWGAMVDYQPKVGDQIGFFISAGNARDNSGVTSVRERSNVVLVRLPEGNVGSFQFTNQPPVEPPPVNPPAPPPEDIPNWLTTLLNAINELNRKLDQPKPKPPIYTATIWGAKVVLTPQEQK